ncbi:hypothetical protein EDB80DRAFT_756765 [Ilyonectria destructans]|nr:hypothetical protein EDB80DRAFT_756765 [Ilyonectria destructans]
MGREIYELANHVAASFRTGADIFKQYWRLVVLGYISIVLTGARSWGGFDERPTSAKCYRQERTAMVLSLLLGSLGLLTGGGVGLWSFIDVLLWMIEGIYGTPGCPGGSSREWQY